MAPDEKRPPRSRDDRIEWFTVSYRSLALAGGAIALVLAGAGVFYFLGRHPAPPPGTAPGASDPAGAYFDRIEGSVQVKKAGSLAWEAASKDRPLFRNDLVRTGPGATAEIRFFDGTVLHVRPDILMTIESSANPTSQRREVSVMIHSGEANFQTGARSAPGGTATIQTPTVRTTAERETTGSIQVDESGETGLRIFAGAGRAETRRGQRIDLGANEGVRVDATGKAGSKQALPAAPVLTAPANQSEVSLVDPARTLTILAWKEVPGASTYRVMVDYSPTFARPLLDRQSYPRTQFELRGLDVGAYYWRVAAVDRNGAESAFSDLWRFALAHAPLAPAPRPPLTVEALVLKGNVLHVKGRTEPGASLTLDGQRIDVQSDGTFSEFVTFEDGPRASVALRVTGVAGGVTELRRPVVAAN